MTTEERRLMRLERLKRELKNEEAALENADGKKKLSIESRIIELKGMVARTEIPKVEMQEYPIMLPEETATRIEADEAEKAEIVEEKSRGATSKRTKKKGAKLFEVKD